MGQHHCDAPLHEPCPVDEDDLPGIVTVHQAAFRGFFLSQLGPAFLREYYRTVLRYPGGILIAVRDGGSVVAFVAGFVEPGGFYRELRRRRLRLALAALPGLLGAPSRLGRMLANGRRTREEARTERESAAELASIAVHPSCASLGMGQRLVHAFLSEARERGARSVQLTTDAKGNEAVNCFYARLGFVLDGVISQGDRMLNRYVYHLSKEAKNG